ncbi:MAG: glucokinase [Acidobacteria bacterium 37-71-11]|nr:MAG: glucokinase [Acidobacteria bacterium 37-71-11]HQT93638.1 glucokinase [Thermoanaerobaculaceae bacterium]
MTVVLAGDVGGTKTLLALAELDGTSVKLLEEERFPSPEYPGLAEIVAEFLARVQTTVAAACFGVPGAVLDGSCTTPNLPWVLTERELAAATGVPAVRLINDFAAAAVGVLATPPASLATLQQGAPAAHGTMAVLGAGTGLGQALLLWDGRRYRVHPTEGGHGGFAPEGALQRELLAYLEASFNPVSVERVVSGPGLARVYRFLVERGAPTAPEVARSVEQEDPGAVIAGHALAHTDPACEQALDLFAAAFGAEAGNLALRSLATGGVYVAGGIAPKILPKLQDGTFLEAFRRKGRMGDLMRTIPLVVVLEERTGLLGAALEAAGVGDPSLT